MGSLSIWHWLIVLAVVLLLFGGSSKISTLMGDFAKGIKSFKRHMGEDESMEHGAPAAGSIAAPHAQAPQVAPGPNVAPAYQQAPPFQQAPAYQQGAQPQQSPYPPVSPPVEPVRHQG
ncbi:twin-arginine translocase TatA/TatE family subunit [Lichenicola sp.]|uniref:twin-arginine translocase TatA/TatE family subunit n=1 Tax=Lichenicola sp. TaxID=2804529 RepID=UPI003AFF6BB2